MAIGISGCRLNNHLVEAALSGWTESKILSGRRTGVEKQNGVLNADSLIICKSFIYKMDGFKPELNDLFQYC